LLASRPLEIVENLAAPQAPRSCRQTLACVGPVKKNGASGHTL
jgi:hypothetical protein